MEGFVRNGKYKVLEIYLYYYDYVVLFEIIIINKVKRIMEFERKKFIEMEKDEIYFVVEKYILEIWVFVKFN